MSTFKEQNQMHFERGVVFLCIYCDGGNTEVLSLSHSSIIRKYFSFPLKFLQAGTFQMDVKELERAVTGFCRSWWPHWKNWVLWKSTRTWVTGVLKGRVTRYIWSKCSGLRAWVWLRCFGNRLRKTFFKSNGCLERVRPGLWLKEQPEKEEWESLKRESLEWS